jgi:hypothetical protein
MTAKHAIFTYPSPKPTPATIAGSPRCPTKDTLIDPTMKDEESAIIAGTQIYNTFNIICFIGSCFVSSNCNLLAESNILYFCLYLIYNSIH